MQSDVVTEHPLNRHIPWEAITHPLTPTEEFFCRNHNEFPDPPAGLRWGERQLSLRDLEALPQTEVIVTLECAGNGRTQFSPLPPGTPWGIRGMSTASFSGVALKDVLARYPAERAYQHIEYVGADIGKEGAYARSLSLSELELLSPLLALRMNGEALPHGHGGPLRMIVPGYFAMASIKWLQSVSFSDQPCQGYFQLEDYQWQPLEGDSRPVTWVLPKSILAHPLDQTQLSSPCKIQGQAWGGRAAASGVRLEVETPDGTAVLKAEARLGPELSPWAWRAFEAELNLPPGPYRLFSFCRTETEEQPRQAIWNKQGYENNSAHSVSFTVS